MSQEKIKDAESLASSMDNSVKRGLLSIIVLYILNESPSHGYKILQEVGKKTQGVLKPQDSTVYGVLYSLEGKGLIKIGRIIETGNRKSKEYEITPLGEEVLELLTEKLKDIVKVVKSMLISFFGLDLDFAISDDLNF